MARTSPAGTQRRPSWEPDHPWLLPALLMSELDTDPNPGRVPRTRRDWVLDVGYVVIALLAGTASWVGYYFAEPPVAPTLLAVDAAGVLAGCVALWLWRRWPIPCAVLTAALVFVVPSIGVAGGINGIRTTIHRRFPVALAVAALSVTSWLCMPLLYPIKPIPYKAHVAIVLTSILAILAWGSFIRARRQLLLSLTERARRAEADHQLRVDQAKRSEREHIAREMHDVLAHRLSLLSMHAGALEFRRDAAPSEVSQSLRIIRSSAHQALQDLREVIGVLRADSGDLVENYPQPTLARLPALVADAREAGMRITYQAEVTDADEAPGSVARTAYRIVQEALTNARKHAPGATVTLAVSGGPGTGLTVDVRNAVPVTTRAVIPGSGTGLIGLAERASLAGGSLEHGVTPEGEFRLTASLPWPA